MAALFVCTAGFTVFRDDKFDEKNVLVDNLYVRHPCQPPKGSEAVKILSIRIFPNLPHDSGMGLNHL